MGSQGQEQLQQQGQGQPQQAAMGSQGQQQQQQPPRAGTGPAGSSLLPQVAAYQLESLTHMFVRCPAIREAWVWFAGMWDRVQPGAGVDCSDVRVLLLDDASVWRPPAELQQLWTHLRLLMLESIWVVRCTTHGRQYSSSQVVSRFLAALQQQLKQDWVRTRGDIRANSGVPLSWLRGRNPDLSSDKFVAKWRSDGVLYTVSNDGVLTVCIPR